MKILSKVVIAFLFSLNTYANSEGYIQANTIKASIESENYKTTIKNLKKLEVDIAGVDIKNNIVDVLLNDQKHSLLLKNNFNLHVTWAKGVSLDPLVDQAYQDAFEVETFVRNANSFFPELTKLVEIGKSFEGRSIWALKISDNAEVKEVEEPAILFNSMHHAREVMTPEVSLDIIEHLLTNYESDSKIRSWVDNNEIWVVPMLNVDGNSKIWAGHNLWRKNTRDGHGVDLNRNYPFGWNSCNG